MTVAELIDLLSELDETSVVYIDSDTSDVVTVDRVYAHEGAVYLYSTMGD